MKKRVFILFFLMTAIFSVASACEFSFEVEKGKKEKYVQGDEIVVLVRVSSTHRICTLSIESTKFDVKGFEILGGTDWKEERSMVWTRKIKLKVTGTSDGKLSLSATRTCDKVGGFGIITFISKPVKQKKK